MKIKFDYRFDTQGFFNNSNRRAALEKAGEIWSSLLNDEFEDIPVGVEFTIQNPTTGENEKVILDQEIDDILIFVGANTSPFAGNSGGEGLMDSHHCHLTGCCCCECSTATEDIVNLSQPGTLSQENSNQTNLGVLAQAKVDGTDLKGDIFQRRISNDFRNNGVVSDFEPWAGTISFNSQINWDFSLDNPDQNKVDFISVALHEIGHVLGIGTAPIFDSIGAGASFNGVNALKVNNGNPIPLEQDLGHVKEGFAGNTVLLDPTKNSGRNLPTAIDLALLADIGYEIDGFIAQGSTPEVATSAGETIFGSIIGDNLDGLGGNDRLQGDLGNDTLAGNAGQDTILGGIDNDYISGEADGDQLQGGTGNDTLDGGESNDLLFGEDGQDLILGGKGQDQLQGGKDHDTLKGNAGNDTLFGQDGNDLLFGDENNDQLQGDAGNDTLVGGSGDDTLFGQAGSDRFLFEANNGKDTISDFIVAEDKIELAAELGFTTGTEVLNAVTKTGSTTTGGLFSEISLSSGNIINVFHDNPLKASNFIIDLPLQVTAFESTASGFVVQFNQQIDIDLFNIYDGQSINKSINNNLPDLSLVGKNSQETIRGSAVWNNNDRTLTFVKTGGILAADEYTLTLFSREDGLVSQSGRLLDGNLDGKTGDNFTTKFTINNSNSRVLSIADFSRGQGQKIDFPAENKDLAIALNNGAGVTQVDFTLTYDSDILGVKDILVNPDLAGNWQITQKNLNTPGQAKISLKGQTALTTGEVELVFIDAEVPDTATYGKSGIVQLESVNLNSGKIAAVGDTAIEQVAYLGDASGNSSYSGLDASLIARFSVGSDSGFDAYRAIDPLLIGDINSDGSISALDASLVARQAKIGSIELIPDLPV